MSINPLITFKAGACELDTGQSPAKVVPQPTPGFIFLYEEDELINFCWRPRSAPMSRPELKLVMVPTDGQFLPYNNNNTPGGPSLKSTTNGRIFVLKFQSSTQRHFFWMQSKSQHSSGDTSFFSPRDIRIGECVDQFLQGDEVNVQEALANVTNDQQGGDGDDQHMEDVTPSRSGAIRDNQGNGDPFMGDPGNGGEEPREGGAPGGRAAAMPSDDATAAVQNFLRSMQGNQAFASQPSERQEKISTTLPDLLPPSTTIPSIDSISATSIDNLLCHLPPDLLLLSQEADIMPSANPSPENAKAAMEALNIDQKREILRKVLRSPQFSQSLSSLTGALRDGGLPTISEALKIPVKDGGYVKRGGVPLGGGDAVEAFLDGVKEFVEKESGSDEGKMDTD